MLRMLAFVALAGAAISVFADASKGADDIVAATPEAIQTEARWSRFERDRTNALLAHDFPGNSVPREDVSATRATAGQNRDATANPRQ